MSTKKTRNTHLIVLCFQDMTNSFYKKPSWKCQQEEIDTWALLPVSLCDVLTLLGKHTPMYVSGSVYPDSSSAEIIHSFQFASNVTFLNPVTVSHVWHSWWLHQWNTLSPWFPGHCALLIFFFLYSLFSLSCLVLHLPNLLTGWLLRVLSFFSIFFSACTYLFGYFI